MDLTEINTLNGQRHPWELVRAAFFSSILHNYAKNAESYLDVGSGDAWFASQFWKKHMTTRFVCWDSGYGDDHTEGLIKQVQETKSFSFTPTQPEGLFDAVLLMDVLEHVENDVSFLSDIVNRNVKDKGYVLISVPAWPWLFSHHDVRLHHHRRYTPKQMQQLAKAGGLKIVDSGGLFASLLVARIAQKGLQRLSFGKYAPEATGNWEHGAAISKSIEMILRTDAYFLFAIKKGLSLKIPGLSWWALCQK